MIGGNITAELLRTSGIASNTIGEQQVTMYTEQTLTGFLDLMNGTSDYDRKTKLQDTTHIFICDYIELDRSIEGSVLKVGDQLYDILLIDDPMELHEQLEIYLKYIGGAYVDHLQ